jgi:hypothetical protein
VIVASRAWRKPGDSVIIVTNWHGEPCEQPAVIVRRATRREYYDQPKPEGAVLVNPAGANAFYQVAAD